MVINRRVLKTTFYIAAALSFLFFLGYYYVLSRPCVEHSPHKINWGQHPVIVFESDDWGATRIFADKIALEMGSNLLSSDYRKKFEKLISSTLESPSDLDKIFSILSKHTGADGLAAVFTANYVLCSPDYKSIREHNYAYFHHLEIPTVPSRWSRGDFVAKAREGRRLGVWSPEYHGFLHMDPYRWMELLRNGDVTTHHLFDIESYAAMNGSNGPEYTKNQDIVQQKTLISNGIKIFRDVFGYSPHSSIAPFYIWQSRTEELLAEQGIKVIQAKNEQVGCKESHWYKLITKGLSMLGFTFTEKIFQIEMGDSPVDLGIIYLTRNVTFEPLLYPEEIDRVIAKIQSVWSENKPVVISTHRFNYVSLDPSSSNAGLRQLDTLLRKLKNIEPNLVYLTDWELAQHYLYGYSVRKIGNRLIIRNLSDFPKIISLDVKYAKNLEKVIMPPKYHLSAIFRSDRNQLCIPQHTICIIQLTDQTLKP